MRFLLFLGLIHSVSLVGQRENFHNIDFQKADSTAYHLEGASLKNLPLLTFQLTDHLSTDIEKFRAMYLWVCTNVENDYASYVRTKKKRKKIKKDEAGFLAWNKGYTPKMFKRLVENKKTACTGYAYLIKEMANLAGLECEIINGFGRVLNANLDKNSVPNHSWNAVRLNNEWYLCDATWSAGTFIINDGIPSFKKDFIEGYFLTKPEFFAKNHYPLQQKWLLTKTAIDFQDFLEGPLLYKDAFQLSVFPKTPEKMQVVLKKGDVLEIMLTTQENLEESTLLFKLDSGSQTEAVSPLVEHKKDTYILRHPFERRGSYDLHLHIMHKPIATYGVKVTR